MQKAPWTILDRKINVALVGCGRISKNHLHAITEHQDKLTLTAVCDRDEAAAEVVAKAHQATAYTSLDTMLKEAEIDLVILCTPSGMHPKQTIQVATAGKHVLTEKPMATRWKDGLDMVKACDTADVRLFVVKQNRLNPPIQALKQAIDANRFGKIYLATVNVFWTRPQDYYDQGGWRGSWEWDGGAFMNQASHYMDLIQWLLGPVESVQAMMGTLGRKIEAEDTGVLNIRWRQGAMGSVNVTMLTYPKNYEGSITILGEKGTVRIGGLAVNQVKHWEFDEARPEDEIIQAKNYETASVYGFGHVPYYANVVDCLQGKPAEITDGRSGLAALELLVAAYRSARDDKTMHLPLEL
ncbi:MAG: Gfo/Idh/MocA family oxidoreductase [Gammaproteobacteria bacterium]|nr:Gfo/Idh/MocA family oxidoreductase [Gammaproteobacteria bacterium]MCH9763999.1 Gfo/Idh/MocA family oxidoreductase [Gammaproteobacteria bacterium]